ncbi:hypothetical protein PG299_10075 [Riemerella anatipestifer]|nr:hypothetical protein [Riemerella anatipestifer]
MARLKVKVGGIRHIIPIQGLFSQDKYILHSVEYPYAYGGGIHMDRTFVLFGGRSSDLTFNYENPILNNGDLFSLKRGEEKHIVSQQYSLLNFDWSTGIIVNYLPINYDDIYLPTDISVLDYYIDINVYNEKGGFVKGDRLYFNSLTSDILDSQGNVISSIQHHGVYLKLYHNDTEYIFGSKIPLGNVMNLNKTLSVKGAFHLSIMPNGYTFSIDFKVRYQLFGEQNSTSHIINSSANTFVKVKRGNGVTTNSWRNPSDKHFLFYPNVTKNYQLVFNTDKSVNTEVMVQGISLIYESNHGNMSEKPLLDLVGMIGIKPYSVYVYGKNEGRRFSQVQSVIIH